jgi:DNA-binding NarL/FixJ family response regulator
MEVIGEATDKATTLNMVKQIKPDVVIIDLDMPNLKGINIINKIASRYPHTKVIALIIHPDKQIISKIFKAGASGYLLKNCKYEDVEHAVRSVVRSKMSLSPKKIDNYMNILYGTRSNA